MKDDNDIWMLVATHDNRIVGIEQATSKLEAQEVARLRNTYHDDYRYVARKYSQVRSDYNRLREAGRTINNMPRVNELKGR